MKLKLFDKVLFRVPQFPVDANLEDCWPELKRSIKDASVYFYNIIKDLEYEDIDQQPLNVKHTIAKYFNRAKFRATPYGTFAGIGVCSIERGSDTQLVLDTQRREYRFTDWKHTECTKHLWKSRPFEELSLQANSSYYRIGDVIRYIYKNEDRFELSDIPYYKEIEQILKICSQTTTYTQLLDLREEIGLDKSVLEEIVSELIESQLLFTNLHPNIIGDEYFKRINEDTHEDKGTYTICNHKLSSGCLDAKDFQVITKTISLLHRQIDDQSQSKELTTFIDQFRAKYDMQAVPIMEVLDPVLGIGYGGMEIATQTSEMINKILEGKKKETVTSSATRLKQFLEQKITSGTSKVIFLDNIFSETVPDYAYPLPNTLSAIVTKSEELLIVDHLGGTTATTLLGRFNLIGEEVHSLSKAIAEIEQEANPEVCFFDLAYMGEPQVDNINRRRTVYDHQLCILCWDDADDRINLDDILLFVRGTSLILYSRSLKKRLIPRMSTAYNYTRSDLSLFRLLCDIQAQEIKSILLPDLQQVYPDVDHYPRMQYKNVVLAREAWKINYHAHYEQSIEFMDYLNSLELSRYIKVGYADQTIKLDITSEKDISLLTAILKSRKNLWIYEAFSDNDSIVKDRKGKCYTSEFILSFYHKAELYKNILPEISAGNSIKRSFPPGSEWIYFKLYSNTSISNEILTEYLTPLIENTGNSLACWFFIRYDEEGDHLRLRLKPISKELANEVFNMATLVFRKLFESGLLKDIQVATYHRELERYGGEQIGKIESHFSIDSEYCLFLISHRLKDNQLYQLTSKLMMDIGASVFEPKFLLDLFRGTLKSFQKEHVTDNLIYRDINKAYYHQEPGVAQEEVVNKKSYDLLKTSSITILKNSQERNPETLFVDLFHMHINRLFPSSQRIHEYIIYEYIYKHLKRQQKVFTS